jgi:hypothetical protein
MRRFVVIGVLAGVAALAARSVAAEPPPSSTAPPATEPAPSPRGEIQTPDRAGTANLSSVAEAPLHDLNIVKQGIPPVLLSAVTNPYEKPNPLNCAEITRQVHILNVALGADFDEPETPQKPSLTQKSGRVAMALAHGAAESLLPFYGYVRTLSGAQRHDQLIIAAITAGSVRRGYLKGLGEARRCERPATPNHFIHPPPPAREEGSGPKYPIN